MKISYHGNHSTVAEGEGFEPPMPIRHAGFQDQCNQPDSATPPKRKIFENLCMEFRRIRGEFDSRNRLFD